MDTTLHYRQVFNMVGGNGPLIMKSDITEIVFAVLNLQLLFPNSSPPFLLPTPVL